MFNERDNSYYFFRANQQSAGTKIYSLAQYSLTVNECDWRILAGKDHRNKKMFDSRPLPRSFFRPSHESPFIRETTRMPFYFWNPKWFLLELLEEAKSHCSTKCWLPKLLPAYRLSNNHATMFIWETIWYPSQKSMYRSPCTSVHDSRENWDVSPPTTPSWRLINHRFEPKPFTSPALRSDMGSKGLLVL